MQCQTPYQLKERDKLTGDIISVPCGKCPPCIKRYASGWSFRLLQQEKVSLSAMFITLTYSEENVLGCISPRGYMTLKKEHFQNFMKRLREYSENKLKYYAVGEYGSLRNRPHFHVILFNAKAEDVEKAWGLGYIHYGEVEGASIGYCLKYMCKKHKRIGVAEGDDREPEFALMSKGIGLSYINNETVLWHLSDVDNRMHLTVDGGKKCSMPRYYKDKVYTDKYFETQLHADQVRKVSAMHIQTRMMNQKIREANKIGVSKFEHNKLESDKVSWLQMDEQSRKGDKL